MNTRKKNSKSQRILKLNARTYRGRVSMYPACGATGKDWFDLIFKKLLLGRVYGVKAQIGWGVFWTIVCLVGYYLTGSGWWFGALVLVGLLKSVLDVHEESADMKERMRERYEDSCDTPVINDTGATGSVYDGIGGFGCSPNGFFGWEVPCAAAKADFEMMFGDMIRKD